MAVSVAPANFLVDPFELRKAGTVLLTAVAMIEASHAARAGRPVAFIFGQATLAPIVADLIALANACGHSAANYEACEANLTPSFMRKFESLEPALAKALASVALQVDTAIGGGETAVAINKAGSSNSKFPTGTQDLLAKLGQASAAQEILIETGTSVTGRQFILYLPGTQNWQPVSNGKVFDLTSDLAAMAAPGTSGPERAAVMALRDSGFGQQPNDKLVIAGYSEGGLIGANLIATGAITGLGGHVSGLISIGSPISSVKLPASVKVVSIEHVNDPVPKLDLANRADTPSWHTVLLPPVDFPGHSLASYRASLGNPQAASSKFISEKLSSWLEPGVAKLQEFQPRRT